MDASHTDIIFSVIIVSYNCLPYIQNVVKSIWENNDINDKLEVIVVDNSTDDQTVNWLAEFEPNVIAIKNNNKGFGQGNNVGSKVAHGQYLLFLNPDTFLVEPIFKWAISQFNNDKTLGLFGIQLVNDKMERNISYCLRMPFGLLGVLFYNFCVCFNLFIPKLMCPIGADMFIPKSVFQQIDGFDENIFMYCEEPDICNRINGIGLKVSFFSSHKVIHYEGKTCALSLYDKYIKDINSRKYYCKKYNIDFKKFGKRERNYCRFKKIVAGLLGDQKRKNQFQLIVEYWNNELHE